LVLLVDTNIWLAAADRRSDRHQACTSLLRDHQDDLAAPVPVIAETSWLILDRLDLMDAVNAHIPSPIG
jgi:predicted nucleic acid-binding protein